MNADRSSVAEYYTVREAARLTALSVDMVNYLARHKVVVSSGNRSRGRGRVRLYTFADLVLLRAIGQLLERGISVLRLNKSFASAQRRGKTTSELLSRKYLVTDGYNVYFQDSGKLELLESGQLAFAFVLELDAIRISVRTGLHLQQVSG
jgi:DNA-binding transcriptional MerR regulator